MKYLNKKANHHHTLLKYSLLKLFNSNFQTSIPVPITWESPPPSPPLPLPPGRLIFSKRQSALLRRFPYSKIYFSRDSICLKTIA